MPTGQPGGREDRRRVPRLVARRAPELDARIAIQDVEHRSGDDQAERRGGFEENAVLRAPDRSRRIVEAVYDADCRRARPAERRVVAQIDRRPCGRPSPAAKGAAYPAQRLEPAGADEGGAVVPARARRVGIETDGLSECLARLAFAPGPEPLVAELGIEPVFALPKAFVGRGRMPLAGRLAQRRRLADDDLLTPKRLLDGAAHPASRTMDGQRQVDVADRIPGGDTQPEVPVLDVQLAPLVEATALEQHVPAGHHREGVDVEPAVKQIAVHPRRWFVDHLAGRRIQRFERGARRRPAHHRGRVQEAGFGVLGEVGDLALEFARQPDIVGVEKGHQAAARAAERLVAGTRRAAVGLAFVSDTPAQPCDFGAGVVGGSVVDDDDFVVGVGLLEDRLQGGRNGAPAVVHGNSHSHGGSAVAAGRSRAAFVPAVAAVQAICGVHVGLFSFSRMDPSGDGCPAGLSAVRPRASASRRATRSLVATSSARR